MARPAAPGPTLDEIHRTGRRVAAQMERLHGVLDRLGRMRADDRQRLARMDDAVRGMLRALQSHDGASSPRL